MKPTPYAYQIKGRDHLLAGRRRYLTDAMGLGKSVQALLAAVKAGADTVGVIAPARVVPNWEREAEVWAPDVKTLVQSYASKAVRNRRVEGDIIILDEAHYCKNRKAKRTGHALTIAKSAERAFLLSGTPGRNATDLWTLFDALWPELLDDEYRSYDDWLNYFCTWRPIRVSPYTTVPKITGHRREHVRELRSLINAVCLRRTLDSPEVQIDLPPLRVTMHTLPHNKVFDRTLAANAELITALESEQVEDNPASARLRRLLGELKAPLIADLLTDELKDEQYDKIVVGYYHRAVGDVFAKSLGGFGAVRLDGGTSAARGQAVIDQFNEDPETRVFLGQMTAAGEGLNLQSTCSEVALAEPDWTPDPNRQFIKRVHRIGQTRAVRGRVFCVANSYDQNVMQNIALNANLQEDMGL